MACPLCLSQFQLGTSPPWATPRKIFLSERIPANFFHLIQLPRGKNDGRIPGGEAKFSQTRRKLLLTLAKILKKTTRQYKFFYLESLTIPSYFKLKQNHLKVLSRGYTCNFFLAMAMQFQEIIAFPSRGKNCTCSMSCAGNATSSEKLSKYCKLLIFWQFICQQILPSHRVARLQFFRVVETQ